MHDKHKTRTFGQKLSNPSHWKKGLDVGGEILSGASKSMVILGAESGQPEVSLLGAGGLVASQGAKKISKILKKNIKKKHMKKKK